MCVGKEEVRTGDEMGDELRVVEKENVLLIVKNDLSDYSADAYEDIILTLSSFGGV